MVLVGLLVAVAAYAATQFYRFECVQPFCPPEGARGTTGATEPTPTAFPGSMAGVWTGSIHQTDGRDWSIELRINKGATLATVLYRELGCAGTITFDGATGGTVSAREEITTGSCTPKGTITLTPAGANLDWSYVPDGETYKATGRLSRAALPS
jgi:hypothetical protein